MVLGDEIVQLDGKPVTELVATWKPFYAASNDAMRQRDLARFLTWGPCGPARMDVLRSGKEMSLNPERVAGYVEPPGGPTNDLPGDTFRMLSRDVAYLKLSSVKVADIGHYLEAAANSKGLIVDIRNYPSEFVAYALGAHLVERETEFARFTNADLANPGAFHWTKAELLKPGKPHYAGKVVVLVDEVSISQSEYTAMAFRASPQTIIVGSTTAGADGNISPFSLPGGLQTMISGIGVFYPDKRPTQRIGIVPDIVVRPTIAGVRSGRDEVLEEAIRQILGKETSIERIQKMIHP